MKRLIIFLLLFLSAQLIFSQNYSIKPNAISSGGGQSLGGSYTNTSVIGEVIVNNSVSSGFYETSLGFLYSDEVLTLNSPENLSILINGNSLQLSWDTVGNAEYYIVYASDTPTGVYNQISDFSDDFNAMNGRVYWGSEIELRTKFFKVTALSGRPARE